MALESFASILAEQVLEKLASNAYQELSTAWGVKGELKKLEGILKTVSAVLLDAEEKQVNNHQLPVWLDMLKDVLYDAEDVLDEFECETQRKQVLKLYGTTAKKKCLAKNGLGCLTSLRILWISECENLEYLFEDMQGLKHLRSLCIELCKSLISLPQNLKYITALETLAIADCENLNLTMEEGKDNQDLARFSLQNLVLGELPKLVEFPEWLLQGSTNTLQLLVLRSCENLKELPACLQNIASLQQLVIRNCDQLSGRCERGQGEDWSKIAHIPNIILDGSEISSTGN